MRTAELGWAKFGEDGSLNELCARVAALLGKAAATWVPTCGIANLAAMLTFCKPGEQVVLEAASHVLSSESMGITEIARLEPLPLWAQDGRMDPAEVEELVAASHAALLILENTHTRAGGTTLSVEADRGARRRGQAARLPGPHRRRAPRQRFRGARGPALGPRGAGELGRLLAEQGPLGAVRRRSWRGARPWSSRPS